MAVFNFSFNKADRVGTKAYRTHVTAAQLKSKGQYAMAQAKFDEAFKLYGEAFEIGCRQSNILISYGILTMQRGDYERARMLMLEANKDKAMNEQNRFDLRVNYAICEWKMGKLDKAIETMRIAAQSKKNGQVYNTLGMLLVEQAKETGEYAEVLAFNEEALDYDDEDAATLDNMGEMYLNLSKKKLSEGDKEGAKADRAKAKEYFAQAYKYKDTQITTIYRLATLEHEDGNDQKARELLEGGREIPTTALCPISRGDYMALYNALK